MKFKKIQKHSLNNFKLKNAQKLYIPKNCLSKKKREIGCNLNKWPIKKKKNLKKK